MASLLMVGVVVVVVVMVTFFGFGASVSALLAAGTVVLRCEETDRERAVDEAAASWEGVLFFFFFFFFPFFGGTPLGVGSFAAAISVDGPETSSVGRAGVLGGRGSSVEARGPALLFLTSF